MKESKFLISFVTLLGLWLLLNPVSALHFHRSPPRVAEHTRSPGGSGLSVSSSSPTEQESLPNLNVRGMGFSKVVGARVSAAADQIHTASPGLPAFATNPSPARELSGEQVQWTFNLDNSTFEGQHNFPLRPAISGLVIPPPWVMEKALGSVHCTIQSFQPQMFSTQAQGSTVEVDEDGRFVISNAILRVEDEFIHTPSLEGIFYVSCLVVTAAASPGSGGSPLEISPFRLVSVKVEAPSLRLFSTLPALLLPCSAPPCAQTLNFTAALITNWFGDECLCSLTATCMGTAVNLGGVTSTSFTLSTSQDLFTFLPFVHSRPGAILDFTLSCRRSTSPSNFRRDFVLPMVNATVQFLVETSPPFVVLEGVRTNIAAAVKLGPEDLLVPEEAEEILLKQMVCGVAFLQDDSKETDIMRAGGLTYGSLSLTDVVGETMVHFDVKATVPAGSMTRLGLNCVLAGQVLVPETGPLFVAVARTRAEWVESSLPRVWIPSTSSVRLSVHPPPRLQIQVEGVVPPPDMRYECSLSVELADALTESEEGGDVRVNTTSTAGLEEKEVQETPYLLSTPGLFAQGSLPEMELRDVVVSASWGSRLRLVASCRRGEEVIAPISTMLEMTRLKLRLSGSEPPTSLPPSNLFSLAIDVEADPALDSSVLITVVSAMSCSLHSSDGLQIIGGSAVPAEGESRMIFPAVRVIGLLAHTYALAASCHLGLRMIPSSLHWRVSLQDCEEGMEPSREGTSCQACGKGLYSRGGLQPCRSCPQEGVQCVAGRLEVLQGFSPSESRFLSATDGAVLDDKATLHACDPPEACGYKESTSSFFCTKGYAGPVCGGCDEANEYVRTPGRCVRCWSHGWNVFAFVLLLLLLLGFLIYTTAWKRYYGSFSAVRISLRILLSYVQVLGSLGTFAARATEEFRAMLNLADIVGDSVVALRPVRCLLDLSIYAQLWLTLGLAGGLVLLTGCFSCLGAWFWYRWRLRRGKAWTSTVGTRSKGRRAPPSSSIPMGAGDLTGRASGKTNMAQKDGCGGHGADQGVVSEGGGVHDARKEEGVIEATSRRRAKGEVPLKVYVAEKQYLGPVVFILFFLYSPLASTIAKVFACSSKSFDGRTHLLADGHTPCYDAAHTVVIIVGGAVLVLFHLLLPLVIVLLLRRNKSRLQETKWLTRLGFVYRGYSLTRGMYWWEVVVLYRRLIVALLPALISDPYQQVTCGIVALTIALALHLHARPYSLSLFNHIEALVIIALLATQIVALLYLRGSVLGAGLLASIGVTIFLCALHGSVLLTLLLVNLPLQRLKRCCAGRCGRRRAPRPYETADSQEVLARQRSAGKSKEDGECSGFEVYPPPLGSALMSGKEEFKGGRCVTNAEAGAVQLPPLLLWRPNPLVTAARSSKVG